MSPTDDALLGKKEYKEVLEPLAVRTARTRAFLELFKPGVNYDLVPLNDVYGPTGWDPNVHALVVSKETLPGAASSELSSFPRLLLAGSVLLTRCNSPQAAGGDVASTLAYVRNRRHFCDGVERGRG